MHTKTHPVIELIKTLGITDSAQEEIRKVYETNPEVYYKYYRESPLFRSLEFEIYPIRYYRSLQMVAGIIMKEADEEKTLMIDRIIKRGYSKIYRYIMQSSKVAINKIFQIMLDGRELKDLSETEFLNGFSVTRYLIIREEKPFNGIDFIVDYVGLQAGNHVKGLTAYTKEEVFFNEGKLDELYTLEERKEIEEIRANFAFGIEKIDLNNVVDFYIDQNVDEMVRKELGEDYPINEIFVKLREELRIHSFKAGSDAALIGFLSGLGKAFGFFEPMYVRPLPDWLSDKFLFQFNHLFKHSGISDDRKKDLFIISNFIVSTLLEYREVRNNYLVNYEDETEYMRKDYEKKVSFELEKLKQDFVRVESKLAAEMTTKKELAQKHKDELQAAKKEIERLKKELADKSEFENEIVALRNYTYLNESAADDKISDNANIEELAKEIESKDLVVIGGSVSWVNRIKEYFPNYTYLSVDEKGRSFDTLKKGNRHILFNTATNSHSIYRKFLKSSNPTNKLIYMNSNSGIDKVVRELYEFFKEN